MQSYRRILCITKAKYYLNEDGDANQGMDVTIDGVDMFVPLDPATDITKQSKNG